MSTLDDKGHLPAERGVIITAVGRKGSGKSLIVLHWLRTYPGDWIVIDVVGDDGPAGPDVHTITGPLEQLPGSWPEHLRDVDEAGNNKPLHLRYVPDMGSPTLAADIDHMIGLALEHGHCAIVIHEIGIVAPVHQTQPNMRRLLMTSRHHAIAGMFAGPRPRGIDSLVIAQSDLVYIFDTPNPDDRKHLAQSMGWPTHDLDDAVTDLRQHEYLMYDANEPKPDPGEMDMRLVHYPPLPADLVDDVLRWCWPHGKPTKERQPR